MKKAILFLFFILWVMFSEADEPNRFTTKDYVIALKKVTDIMVNDATSPVAASRYYAYITLAAQEVQSCFLRTGYNFFGSLNHYKTFTRDTTLVQKADASLSVIYAVIKMGEKLLPSGYLLQSQSDSVLKVAEKRGFLKSMIEHSQQLAESVIRQLQQYVQEDGFRNLSGYPRYTPQVGDAMWQPTAPVFMQALEPHWNRVRTFILDSAQQFKPDNCVNFDTTKNSSFYRQLHDVYIKGRNLNKEEKAIAMFWDCNPFAVQQIGHIEFALKKISPGGHWMGITGIACQKKKTSLQQAVFIHTVVAITLADAFISCWDEKYRSNRVRPETAINKWIDPRWRPLLQTPPFPEYTSGHSVISTAAAVILSKIFGDNFSFSDSTEIEFGLPIRRFRSFTQAAEEAAISRFYGGIHYRDAIVNGQHQGKRIGNFVIEKLKL